MLANVLVNYPDLTFIKIFTKWTKHAVHEIECSVQRLVKKIIYDWKQSIVDKLPTAAIELETSGVRADLFTNCVIPI